MLKRLPIRLKLILLAGVPVIGALILATMMARDARHQAERAAAIGSIEDLAHLSAQMSGLVHALQFERNELSLALAQKKLAAPELTTRFGQTDAARKKTRRFPGYAQGVELAAALGEGPEGGPTEARRAAARARRCALRCTARRRAARLLQGH